MHSSFSLFCNELRQLSPLFLLATVTLIRAPAAEEDRLGVWEQRAAEAQKTLRNVTHELIALVEDTKASKEERWRAVLALGRLGTRESLEFLVDHVSLRILPPHWKQMGGDEATDWPCFWALTNLPNGWEGSGRNWNLPQVILRATSKPRTEDELWRYAHLLKIGLDTRFCKNAFGDSSRALAVVTVELANESQASRYVEPEQVIKDRAIRVKNLSALKSLLEKWVD
jgi:hypothetical protein